MEAIELLEKINKMCEVIDCEECPFRDFKNNCYSALFNNPKAAIEAYENWAKYRGRLLEETGVWENCFNSYQQNLYKCSHCGGFLVGQPQTKFCPHCGVEMTIINIKKV